MNLLAQELTEWTPVHFLPGTVSGSGNPSAGGSVTGGAAGDGYARLNTGATASNYAAWYFNLFDQFATSGATARGGVDFSVPMWLTFKFSFATNALGTNGYLTGCIGKNNGAGALNATGFGFKIVYKSANIGSLLLQTYDGSLHTSAELAEVDTSTSGICHEVTLASDGAGNVFLFLDGVYKGTAATGPAASAAPSRYLVWEIGNGADSVDYQAYITYVTALVKKN